MKKFLLSLSLIIISICLVGCTSQAQDMATKLDAHLDRLNNVIASVDEIRSDEITFNKNTFTNANTNQPTSNLKNPVVKNYEVNIAVPSSNIYTRVVKTNDCVNSSKSQIRELISMIKALSSKVRSEEIKLNENQVQGINELLSNLSINTNRISMSKNETNTEVGKVKSMLTKTNAVNNSTLNSRYIRLNNCLETRLTYFNNCIDILNQVRILLSCDENCTYKDGQVCIDGVCYDETELSKYGEQDLDQKDILDNEKDKLLFEEFREFMRQKRQQGLDTKIPESLENKDVQQDNNTAATPYLNQEEKTEKTNYDDQVMPLPLHPQTQPSSQANDQQTVTEKTFEVENKESEQPNNTNEQTQVINDDKKGFKNVNTYKNPTVRPNINSFRTIGNKAKSPQNMLELWATKNLPFPEEMTETNINIDIDGDKTFVESTNVA